ncbi:hypothetical protein ABZ319_11255 [Nocardia sp. NPDC005978]|uniref:hypothetical protein n=1 Tax=Nocardia sp. NPDC005978 TaxID=3156725 RepID=UPI0033B8F622
MNRTVHWSAVATKFLGPGFDHDADLPHRGQYVAELHWFGYHRIGGVVRLVPSSAARIARRTRPLIPVLKGKTSNFANLSEVPARS